MAAVVAIVAGLVDPAAMRRGRDDDDAGRWRADANHGGLRSCGERRREEEASGDC
jgi:hypothetical protein